MKRHGDRIKKQKLFIGTFFSSCFASAANASKYAARNLQMSAGCSRSTSFVASLRISGKPSLYSLFQIQTEMI